MGYLDTLGALLTALLFGWVFRKFIEPRLDKTHELVRKKINGGNKMGKLIVDIEHGSNGGYVVTHYKNNPTAIQRFTGVQQEKEVLAFADAKAILEYLNKL